MLLHTFPLPFLRTSPGQSARCRLFFEILIVFCFFESRSCFALLTYYVLYIRPQIDKKIFLLYFQAHFEINKIIGFCFTFDHNGKNINKTTENLTTLNDKMGNLYYDFWMCLTCAGPKIIGFILLFCTRNITLLIIPQSSMENITRVFHMHTGME